MKNEELEGGGWLEREFQEEAGEKSVSAGWTCGKEWKGNG